MINRDRDRDIEHSIPREQLAGEIEAMRPHGMIWHALDLGSDRVVLTGHLTCHDCYYCGEYGDIRYGGRLAPWLASYPDCTSTDEEVESFERSMRIGKDS